MSLPDSLPDRLPDHPPDRPWLEFPVNEITSIYDHAPIELFSGGPM